MVENMMNNEIQISLFYMQIYLFCVCMLVQENKRKLNKNRVTQLCNFKIKKYILHAVVCSSSSSSSSRPLCS